MQRVIQLMQMVPTQITKMGYVCTSKQSQESATFYLGKIELLVLRSLLLFLRWQRAKQRELSGRSDSEAEANLKKQLLEAKCKELSGQNIFAPPPEIQPRPLAARALASRESITTGEATLNQPNGGPSDENNENNAEHVVKTSKKIPDQKFAELSGNDIFKGDTPPASDKPLA